MEIAGGILAHLGNLTYHLMAFDHAREYTIPQASMEIGTRIGATNSCTADLHEDVFVPYLRHGSLFKSDLLYIVVDASLHVLHLLCIDGLAELLYPLSHRC